MRPSGYVLYATAVEAVGGNKWRNIIIPPIVSRIKFPTVPTNKQNWYFLQRCGGADKLMARVFDA